MVAPEVKRQIQERVQAFIQVLDEAQNDDDVEGTDVNDRDRVLEALVDLIKALFLPFPDRAQKSASIAQLLRGISKVLRSENEHDRHGPPAYNSRRARRNSVSFSPASASDTTDENSTDLVESSRNIHGRSNRWEGWAPDVAVANPMDLVVDHTDLPTILEETQVPEGMQSLIAVDGICAGHDFEAMLALVADMGDTEPFPPLGSATEIDDMLFVPQPNTHLLPFPSSPPPELETDWLAGNSSDLPLFPPFLESAQQVDQLGASSEQIGEVFELITNTSCTPLSAAASPLSSLNPGALVPANLQSEMQAMETAMERGNTSGIPTDNVLDQFRCAFGLFDGSFVRTLLEQLTQSDRVLGEEVIIYFASKLTTLHTASETWIGRKTSLYELSHSRRRLLIMLWGNNEWSLIEVQPHIGRLVLWRTPKHPHHWFFDRENAESYI